MLQILKTIDFFLIHNIIELVENFWKEVVKMIKILYAARIKEIFENIIVIKSRPMTDL